MDYLMCWSSIITLLLHQGVTGNDRKTHYDAKGTHLEKLGFKSAQKQVVYGSSRKFTGLYTGPYFDPDIPTNITASVGDTALLPCIIKQLGDQTVSWIRKRDAHILTVDYTTFISDDRFFVMSASSAQKMDWTLNIRFVNVRDTGMYECQISTDPSMTHYIHLKVVEPQVTIIGHGEGHMHANSGGRVVFKCRISQTLTKPDYVFWYHNDVRLMTDKASNMNSSLSSISDNEWEASLSVDNVDQDKSGNYTCRPSNTIPATVRLHISDGEMRAAISEGRSPSCTTNSLEAILIMSLFILWESQ